MSYHQITQIEIECDFPGCDEYLLFSDEGWEKIRKMIKAIGWTDLSFPSDEDEYGQTTRRIDFCPNCKDKEIPTSEVYDCVYIRKTKKGKVSEYGSVFECVFCERIK